MKNLFKSFMLEVSRLLLVIVLAIVMTSTGFGQLTGDFPTINTEAIGGKLVSEKSFSKEALFGYMNGGAELYLEYGFDRLAVSEIVVGDSEFKAEIFKMNGKDEAFGIYSVSIFRCDDTDLLTDYYCKTDYQVQFCRGEYYINIINISGSEDDLQIAMKMALNLIDNINRDSFLISAYLPEIEDISVFDRVILISGDIALGSNVYELSELLEGYNDYKALIANRVGETFISLKFETEKEQIRFLDSMGVTHNPPANEEVELDNGLLMTVTFANEIILRSIDN